VPTFPSPADGLPVRGSIVIPRAELRWRFSRSGGPGGQGVNTADSRVELRWDLAGSTALPEPLRARAQERLAGRLVDGHVVIVVTEERAQLRNRQIAEKRLAAMVAAAIAAPPAARRATKPSRGAVERRIEAKRRTSQIKKYRQRPDD
jgi:ribosome-associated protein